MKIHIESTSYLEGTITGQSYTPNRCLIFFDQLEDIPAVNDLFIIGDQVSVSGPDQLRRSLDQICLLYEKDDTKEFFEISQFVFEVRQIIKVYGYSEGSIRVSCDYTLMKYHDFFLHYFT